MRAWVGNMGPGYDDSFSAYAEYDLAGPFVALPGPVQVSIEDALGWARARADRVSVRVGNVHYSAGSEPIRSLPAWPGPDPEPRPAKREGAARPRRTAFG